MGLMAAVVTHMAAQRLAVGVRKERLLWSFGGYFESHCCIRSRSGLVMGGLVAAQRKGLYDEPRIRMDGRRDVALDGDRHTGGGPAGRLDHQGVQEIVGRSQPSCEVNG